MGISENTIKRIEPFFFCLVVGLSLMPVLCYKFFPTLDGPAHLYNSTLIKNLLVGNNEIINKYFVFNAIPVPNWSGHLLIMMFKAFLPAHIAEKMLLILYIAGFAYGFRYLILTVSPENIFFSYLIFPFIFSFFLFLGFYNFSLAIVLLLFSITLWIRYDRKGLTLKRGIILFFFFILTYFSHLFSFLWLLVFICMYMGINFSLALIHKEKNYRDLALVYSKKVLFLLAISIIPIIFVFIYFNANPAYQNKSYIDKVELIEWLKNIRPIIALQVAKEEAFTKKLFYLIGGLLSIIIFNKVNKIEFTGNTIVEKVTSLFKSVVDIKDAWLVASVSLLYLYFKLPDSDGGIGYVSVRLAYFFFIFLVIWISVQSLPKWLGIFSALVALYCHFNLNQFYIKEEENLNKAATECYTASEHIPENSVVLPLNWSDLWLHGHFSNYLGIDKPMVILENYECNLNWFPLKWNNEELPAAQFGDLDMKSTSCLSLNSGRTKQASVQKIDFVFILGNMETHTDSCATIIKQELNKSFELSYSTDHCKLFKLKK